ncbi:MAG: ABC transporter permease [Phycisphaeraceae bacterium]
MPTDDSDVPTPAERARLPRLTAGRFGTFLFLFIALPCFFSLFWTLGTPSTDDKGQRYNDLRYDATVVEEGKDVEIEIQEQWPGFVQFTRSVVPAEGEPAEIKTFSGFEPMGTDQQGRSVFVRCLLGGAISLGVGICAALMAVFIGVTWGTTAGYLGGRVDSFMMRIVDVLYGLPYLLLVVLLSVAVTGVIDRLNAYVANRAKSDPTYDAPFLLDVLQQNPLIVNLITLVVAIGGVSWLTMARVIRGQVLSLRTEPFIEAARAQGMTTARIMRVHLLPNLIGPIVVYTTLAVPQAILQESFLSFLGIGVTPPLPSWGQLASEGIKELPALAIPALIDEFKWWLLVFPCVLLGLTLLSLNFMGDAMRERFDPRSKKRGT